MVSQKAIDRYVRQVGLSHFRSFDDAEKVLKRKYGKEGVVPLFDAISRRADGEAIDVYPLLYQSLEFSIDCMAAYQGSLPKAYLSWLSGTEIAASRILDLGCGNGVLTCFYGSLFPDSQIIGVDKSADGVRCANQLKEKLGTNNVTFVRADSGEELASLGGTYDLITMVTVANEIVDVPSFPNDMFMNEIFSSQVDVLPPQEIASICELLTPETGHLITVNRWSAHGYCWWINVLHKCGLTVDYGAGEQLGVAYDSRATALLSHRQQSQSTFSADDAIAFWLYSNYQKRLEAETFKPPRLENELAEACFLQINPKRLRLGIKVTHRHRPGFMKVEIWQGGPFLMLFQFEHDGQKSLEILPAILYLGVEERARCLVKDFTDEYIIVDYHENDTAGQ